MNHPVTRPPARPPQEGRGDQGRQQGPDRPREPFTPPYDLVQLRAQDGPLRARVDPTARGGRRPMTFAARGSYGRPPGRLRRFVRTYGWRAYAIPLLMVLTVITAADLVRGGAPEQSGAGRPAAAGRTATEPPSVPRPKATGIFVDSPPAGDLNKKLPATALPPGGPYSVQGGGRFDVVPGTSKVFGSGGPLQRFTVEIEAGVSEDGPAFASAVERTLADPHSWGSGGRMTFQRVDSGPVDVRVSLTSSMTVRKLCGYTLPYETSCYNGDLGRAVINDGRWVRGAVAYAADVPAYRNYVINHEVGHSFGRGHQACKKAGALAPVMMQQTLGLTTPGVGTCRANPWPYP